MYHGDPRNISNLYSIGDFMWVSAHKFGHILGVNDAYKSNNSTDVTSIYNGFGIGVQEIDISMVLNAWNTGNFQRWK